MKQYTKSEFANHIRSQYPGSYDDLSDDKLMKLWLKKFPNDTDKIIETDSTIKIINDNIKIIGLHLLFWAGAIILGLSLIGFFINSISIIEQSNTVIKTYADDDSNVANILFWGEVNLIYLAAWLKELSLGVKIGGAIVGAIICATTYNND